MKQYKYKTVASGSNLESVLNDYGKKGWKLTHIIQNLFIFEKEETINIKVRSNKNARNK